MSLSELIPLFAVALTTLAASVTDLWKFKVYNVLTLPTLILGVVVSAILGGWSGFGSSLLGAALGFGLLVVFFAVGGVGGGDVKRPDRRRRLVPYAAMTCLGYLATMAWWGSDLRKVWPPTGRSAAISTVSSANSNSNQDLGGAR
jgi:hypothetical protein